ncbi:hypothetical protein CEK26_002457 [Fusarium fujikuroi]|nr:hypothetical protein CEK27_002451 [Fusarium fujikuroi]QGJ01013.1 hypothetical protein CEK26_002457 [Fusarium fujikuroi]
MVEREQEKAETTTTKKRKSDEPPKQPASKKTKGSTTVKLENSQVAMPPPKPLGNLKGKYAIETFYPCCDDESQQNHDEFCSIVLSPGDGGTLRGYLGLGRTNYTALFIFDKCPTDASTRKLDLVAQKGRGIGERGKHNVAAFWDDWHELDEESLDLFDIDRLIPDW